MTNTHSAEGKADSRQGAHKALSANRLLCSLSAKDRNFLLAKSVLVDLSARHIVAENGHSPQHAYFMLTALASEIVRLANSEVVEIGLVGHEGVTGTFHLLGRSPSVSECFVQIAGSAYRIPLRELEKAFLDSASIRKVILQYVQHQMAHLGQTAACNRIHDAGPRFARWLLTVQDRSAADEFLLTQEFLAQMLGASRITINIVARLYERQGFIDHNRGRIRILDRVGLETVACACYGKTRAALLALYGEGKTPVSRAGATSAER